MFTSEQIEQCMRKVRTIQLHETIRVTEGLEIKAYYAGHVLGAVMFYVRVGHLSLLYTVCYLKSSYDACCFEFSS